jgi:hypothetical protein
MVSFDALKTPASPAVDAPSAKARSLTVTVFRPLLVLADRRPGSAQPRVLEPVHEDQGDRDDDGHEDVEGPRIGERELADEREARPVDAADAVGALGPLVEVQEDDRDDLAEAKGDDGEVVAPQPQRRRAEQDAEQRRRERPDDDQDDERQVQPGERGGPVRIRIRADREEGRVAEVEEAGEADDDVETERQQHEHAGVGKAVDPRAQTLEGAERRHHDDERHQRGEQGHPDDDRDGAMPAGVVADPAAPPGGHPGRAPGG